MRNGAHPQHGDWIFLTLSPTFTEAANVAEEATAARATRGRRYLIMIRIYGRVVVVVD